MRYLYNLKILREKWLHPRFEYVNHLVIELELTCGWSPFIVAHAPLVHVIKHSNEQYELIV